MSFLSNVAGSYESRVKKGLQEAGMGILSALRGRLSSFGLSMPIGSLGPIIFEVSSSKARTFKDMKRNTKGRYGSHEIIGGKPVIEFMGPDGEELSFTMQFSVAWGLNPQEEVQKVIGNEKFKLLIYQGADDFAIINETNTRIFWFKEKSNVDHFTDTNMFNIKWAEAHQADQLKFTA